MANPTESGQHTALKEALPSVLHQNAGSQSLLGEPIGLKNHESVEYQNTILGNVIRDESSSLDPSCNSAGSPEYLGRLGKQEVSGAAFVADKVEPLDRCAEICRHDKDCANTQISPTSFESTKAAGIILETENSFSSSPIKYILSYRGGDGTRFKDEVVENMESLEPSSQNQNAQRDGILEVTRIVTIQEMHIDFTKPLTEQSIAVDQYGSCEIKINSIAIINALNSVIKYWPGLNLNTPSLVIQEPFAILYHHREALQEYADSKSSNLAQKDGERCKREKNVDKHLKLLFGFLDARPEAKKIDMEHERHNRSSPTCTFEMLWMLFSPGTDMFIDIFGDGSYEGFVVKQISGGGLAMSSATPFTIRLWYLDYNGKYIGRTEYFRTIEPFTGEKDVSALSVIPCNLYKRVTAGQISDESKSLFQTLVGCGERFLKLTKRQCVQYSGKTYSYPRRSFRGRVFVDMEGAYYDKFSESPDLEGLKNDEIIPIRQCSCSYCESNNLINNLLGHQSQFSEYEKLRPGSHDFVDLTDHQKFLCEHRIYGYSLSLRTWLLLDIANVSDCKWNRSMIDDQLSIHDGDRQMIKSLVQRYFRGKSSEDGDKEQWSADFISDKGDSQIFLLHGKPGVGKTFTAECVADFVERPLLSLSCSDVGVDSEAVEANLLKFFKKAKLWGAVLLLDEADVYLEQRTARDLERNCLVAAFLRCLEYYQGVLFLTTNRVGVFDDALVSRISVILHYEFDEPRRQAVWTTFFNKLERERGQSIKIPYSTGEYTKHDPELRRLEWNGREIRNAFQMAVALAEYTDERDPEGFITLQAAHFQQVVRMSSNFAKYMRKVHGAETEKVAANRGDRNEYSRHRDAIMPS